MDYAELHCLSNFTFQRGASHPEELIERAQYLGYRALAITDECSFAGLGRAYAASKQTDFPLIVGSEFRFDTFTLVLLVPNIAAYKELSLLISTARRQAPKGSYLIQPDDVLSSIKHCLSIVIPSRKVCANGSDQVFLPLFQRFKRAFANRIWLGLQRPLLGDDKVIQTYIEDIRHWQGIPIAAVGSVDMHVPARQPLRDVLTAIKLRTSVEQLAGRQASNGESHLRSPNKLMSLYKKEYLDQSVVIANRCNFSMSELRYEYPKDLVPEGWTAHDYLIKAINEGANKRYPNGIPPFISQQIQHELDIIAHLRYEHYFLTVWDLVKFARSRDILCQGRGSAANSAICYCLHITEVNPENGNLLFERFLSKERNEPPDIDVDFEHHRREEVIQYIYQRYGRERAALAATVIRYRAKSAIKDVGKALGYDEHYLSRLIQQLDRRDQEVHWLKQLRKLGPDNSVIYSMFVDLTAEILDFPRHLSQHVGGFVIASERVDELVPTENAAMEGRTIIQWDKNDLESLGLLKIDVLALGMLSAIKRSMSMLCEKTGQAWTLERIPREDAETYAMLQNGDSVGVFQVESRAQMSMLPRLKPTCFYDLVVQVAIVRPGPIQGGMVHPYLQRRSDSTLVSYPSAEVKRVLERTLGVPIFQEQVIKLAMVAGGFSSGEADQLRRAMGAWKRTGQLKPFEEKLKAGMLERGYSNEFADRLCLQIRGFGEYGFPESHAASFAMLVYFSAWLKCHEPVIFCCALLNSYPMGFYSPSQLIQDLQRHAGTVLPVCVNASFWDHIVDHSQGGNGMLRLGFRIVNGLSKQAVQLLLNARSNRPFDSIHDFLDRVSINTSDREALASAGAFETLAGNRHQVRWQMLGHQLPTHLPFELNQSSSEVCFESPTPVQTTQEELRRLGVTLGRHLMSLIRERGACRRCTSSNELAQLNHGSLVRVAGIVTGRQRPGTASGVTFITLEDEFGNCNIVVWLATAKAQRQAYLGATLLEVHGILERENNVVHIIAGQLIDRTAAWQSLLNSEESSQDWHGLVPSRDFH